MSTPCRQIEVAHSVYLGRMGRARPCSGRVGGFSARLFPHREAKRQGPSSSNPPPADGTAGRPAGQFRGAPEAARMADWRLPGDVGNRVGVRASRCFWIHPREAWGVRLATGRHPLAVRVERAVKRHRRHHQGGPRRRRARKTAAMKRPPGVAAAVVVGEAELLLGPTRAARTRAGAMDRGNCRGSESEYTDGSRGQVTHIASKGTSLRHGTGQECVDEFRRPAGPPVSRAAG